jgi:AcrR family transcriptional regulator
MDEQRPRRRADAERNRRRILGAAEQAFAERGLDMPLEAVAEQAGVGIGTLYRHFPTREDLVVGCFAVRLAEHVRAAEDALRAPDGWTGFRQYVERTCELQAANRGLTDLLTRSFPSGHALEKNRARAYELILQIIERAKAEGTLRADAVPEDYPLLLMGNAGVVEGLGREAPEAWRRYVALMLEGLRARSATEPLPAPPSPRQVLRATLRLARSRSRSRTTTA